MKSVYKLLQRVDISTAVEYFGVTELLDHIGKISILQYLESLPEEGFETDSQPEKSAAIRLQRRHQSTTVQLGVSQTIIIAAKVVTDDLIDVIIEVGTP